VSNIAEWVVCVNLAVAGKRSEVCILW